MEDVRCTQWRLFEESWQYCQYSTMHLQKHPYGIELISAMRGNALNCDIC